MHIQPITNVRAPGNFVINNLDNMIRRSGLKKQEVADLKGVTPVTLSRHISGAINITLADAEEYGRILGVHSYDILYPQEPIDIIGLAELDGNGKVTRQYSKHPYGKVYMRSYMIQNNACVYWKISPDHIGHFMNWNGALQIIDRTSFDNHTVDPMCIQNFALCELEEPTMVYLPNNTYDKKQDGYIEVETRFVGGILYPEPGNRYSVLHISGNCGSPMNMEKHTMRGLKIKWACPVVGTIYRPELRHMEIKWTKDV